MNAGVERPFLKVVQHRHVQLSVVVPVYNEEAGLMKFHQRVAAVLDAMGIPAEIVLVNDGSSDGSLKVMRQLAESDRRIALVDLSRNFGKEIAMTAGLDHARGEAVVVIDSDLQDPPEVIPDLMAKWQEGYDVVYAVRIARDGEPLLKRLTAYWFYRIMRRVGPMHMPADTGDFRLLSRRAVNALGKLREHHRFMKGLFAWIGFRQTGVPYRRESRFAGRSSWNYWRLWNFALEGITSFTAMPLKIATYAGIITAMLAFVYGLSIIFDTLLHGNRVPGYPSLIVVMLFLGGVQLMSIGIIGEYLGRMFDESKRRPLYLVNDFRPATFFHLSRGMRTHGRRLGRQE